MFENRVWDGNGAKSKEHRGTRLAGYVDSQNLFKLIEIGK
jgi:hypothetical protein